MEYENEFKYSDEVKQRSKRCQRYPFISSEVI